MKSVFPVRTFKLREEVREEELSEECEKRTLRFEGVNRENNKELR